MEAVVNLQKEGKRQEMRTLSIEIFNTRQHLENCFENKFHRQRAQGIQNRHFIFQLINNPFLIYL